MPPSREPFVLYHKPEPGLARITLNRPDRLNAINLAMRDDLWTFLHAAIEDPDVRVLSFHGNSPRAFCAGADVTEFGAAPSLVEARRARHERDLWALLEDLPLITIAALHGFCLGAGIELPLFCDLRIAAEDTVIALPEVGLGYIPSAGGTQTLPRSVPPALALRLVLSGDRIDAREALSWGLVSQVVPNESLDESVAARARRLAAADTATLVRAKHAIRRGLDGPLHAAIARDALAALLQRAQTSGRTTRERLPGEQ